MDTHTHTVLLTELQPYLPTFFFVFGAVKAAAGAGVAPFHLYNQKKYYSLTLLFKSLYKDGFDFEGVQSILHNILLCILEIYV